ncbi:MAG: hypothetical protein EOP08_14950 [Proteobacteria bacterium]|nr:MAG: hypothetical protein EOP08_14950 [Pseudomonadota bacterium]
MDGDGVLALLALGPAGAAGVYWGLYRYYRNTDKSHGFEHETKVDAKPVTGSDRQVGTNNGTRESRIRGDNLRNYRLRVRRTAGKVEP